MTYIEDMWVTPGPQPNGLQAAPDGLWVIDQKDNHLYKLDYGTGAVLADLPTETDRSSGVTLGGGYIWVASTYNARIYKLDMNGKTVAYYDTPGKGYVAFGDPTRRRVTGAHGLEWVDGKLWVAVPPAQKIYLMDPDTMKVLDSIPTPGVRPHGLAWEDGSLWCADTQMGVIHKLEPETGRVLDEIRVPEPEVHGMSLHEGALWFCCAVTCRVCRVPLK